MQLKINLLFIILITLAVSAASQVPENVAKLNLTHAKALEYGEKAFDKALYRIAPGYFERAWETASNDEERAVALLWLGKTAEKSDHIVGNKTLKGNITEARKKYKEIFGLKDVSAQTKLKARYAMIGTYGESDIYYVREHYDEILKLTILSNEEKAKIYVARGKTYELNSNPNAQAAYQNFKTASEIPNVSSNLLAEALTQMGAIHIATGQYENAFSMFNKALALKDISAKQKFEAKFQSAFANGKISKMDEARKITSEAINIKGVSAEDKIRGYGLIADTYEIQQNFTEVLKTYIEVLQIKDVTPQQKADAHKKIAITQINLKNSAGAIAETAKINKLQGLGGEEKYNNLKSFAEQLRDAKLKTEYLAIMEIAADAPDLPVKMRLEALADSARLYGVYANTQPKVREILMKILNETDKENYAYAQALGNIGDSFFMEEKYAEAVKYFEQKAEILKISDSTWADVGKTHLKLKNYAKARDAYTKVVIKSGVPDELIRSYVAIGETFEADGDYENAAKNYAAMVDVLLLAKKQTFYTQTFNAVTTNVLTKTAEFAKRKNGLEQAKVFYQKINDENIPVITIRDDFYFGLGKILFDAEKMSEAKSYLMKVTKSSSRSKEAQKMIEKIGVGS